LWVTYFAFGCQRWPGQTGNLTMHTPAYNAFRTEFPDGMREGQARVIPSFIASANFDFDQDSTLPKMIGCVAVLMEEDATPPRSIVAGRIAYSKEMENQLEALVSRRIAAGDMGPITPEEIQAIKSAVESKVRAAIGRDQRIWGLLRDQDDNLGFTFRTFSGSEIRFQYFDFPEIVSPGSGTPRNRFVLSGGLSLGPVPAQPPVERCAAQRAAVRAKSAEIEALHTRKALLQQQLQHAAPSQKADLIHAISETGAQITRAESELAPLQVALDACMGRVVHPEGGPVVDPERVVVTG
jgi:hypothetical protein